MEQELAGLALDQGVPLPDPQTEHCSIWSEEEPAPEWVAAAALGWVAAAARGGPPAAASGEETPSKGGPGMEGMVREPKLCSLTFVEEAPTATPKQGII